jgi:hypothetical protein
MASIAAMDKCVFIIFCVYCNSINIMPLKII